VSAAPFDLHILILSEDSAGNALPSLRALAKSMLRLVDPHYQDRRVDLEPEGEAAQVASHANLWQGYRKSSASHKRLVTISRTIARHVFAERGFVLYHVDADQAWSSRAAPSHNVRRFHEELTLHVSRAVDVLIAANGGAHDKEAIMRRIHLVSPYWCIESWLYQNTTAGKALCHKHHRGLHADLFERWERHREELDEVDKPKDQVCFGSKHNHELASQGFPTRAVHAVGKSFRETVERLRSSPGLVAALAATHPGY
jgi:hypothetical protein